MRRATARPPSANKKNEESCPTDIMRRTRRDGARPRLRHRSEAERNGVVARSKTKKTRPGGVLAVCRRSRDHGHNTEISNEINRPAIARFSRRPLLWFDVLCSWTFGPLANRERHALSFAQVVKPRADAARLVKEVLSPIRRSDESKAFVGLTLNRARRRRHARSPFSVRSQVSLRDL